MDKNSAINLIDKTFNNAFDEAQFTNFIQNLLNDFEIKPNKYSGNTIWEDQRDHVSYYKRIGKYIDPEGEALDVLIVQVKNVSKLERARTALRNFVIKHLNNFEKDYALVAFYSKEDDGFDWRFSFIKMEHQSYLDEEKQKVKMRKEFTPAKRYSFLVGKYEKSHTAKTQLLPLLQNIANNPTISELEKAFSIERVTDEFFEQYKSLYIKVYEYFEKQDLSIFQDSQLDASGFTKKLLGQIVFLYFLQKKGWLGVPKNERWGAGKRHFLQQLFDESLEKNKNFFKDYLQYLFYEALAKERDNDNSFYPRFNCRIPFLNGGLFEAQYDWKNANISIPTDLFRNDEKNKSGDIGTGILDVFDRYNFTIKEDEPLDKEVAVDPEMLGKVFENMLEIKERKSKGAFYTPREIVHYMCQESLIHYLDNALNDDNKTVVPKEDIEQYIREGHLALENDVRVAERGETKTYKFLLPETVRNNADVIDKKLTEIRICDPAIGSGAFPVGLLHELVTAQLILKPHLSYNYLNNKLKEFDFHERESVSESRYVYRLKKHIIQESIYGVDIDRSAIDIARLRLWLSLVVDEDDLEPIETLPNLDYKIVCGNSLIGMPDGTMRDLEVEKELETLKEEFYTVTNEQRKKTLRNKINTKIRELLDTAETFAGYNIDFDFKLFFSEVWKEKGGFDVVIGNPPYVNVEKIDKNIKQISKTFRTAHMKYDLYVLFYEKGIDILKEKGVISFITSNKFLSQGYGLKLREEFLKHSIKEIINFNYDIFSTATVRTAICQIIKIKPHKDDMINIIDVHSIGDSQKFENLMYEHLLQRIFTETENFNFRINLNKSKINVLERLKDNTLQLEEIFSVNYGLRPVPLDKTKGKDYFIKNEYQKGLSKYFEGKDLGYWSIKEHKYINYLPDEMYNPMFKGLFLNENLVGLCTLSDITKLRFCYTKNDYFTNHSNALLTFWWQLENENYTTIKRNITSKRINNSKNFQYKYVQAILNSDVIKFYFNELMYDGTHFYPNHMKALPIRQLESKYQEVISSISEYNYYLEFSEFKDLYDFFSLLSNSIIFEIYLDYEFQTTDKSILKHLPDLKPINDSMSEEEKLGIIQSEYERLYHPDHPVRFAIETLDSIEEVRIIREALKS
ncbi:Eco57I restriction-modification methylase domain-containing protein [Lutibacter sp. B1]|uniref:Eco57I restriction-modification methylase domain-containing protein n=1 Tax=Lutibacter sp. B1 TaxID=2725996 RepID=UPI001456B75A|nr:N-6 DNA methylase [Lutibacter sp. B1]NLP57500.1 N-6 DNA methylase [Lutibacter sp. B1]